MIKIAVVGGGIAGLSTTYFLSQSEAVKEQKVEVVLLEKENSVSTGPVFVNPIKYTTK